VRRNLPHLSSTAALVSVDALRALAHQKIPRPEDNRACLLRFVLHSDKAHARSLSRFPDRLGIGRVALLPLDERLDLGRRDQSHSVTQLPDLTTPVMSSAAGFQRHQAR
jgi:hypothetical protein